MKIPLSFLILALSLVVLISCESAEQNNSADLAFNEDCNNCPIEDNTTNSVETSSESEERVKGVDGNTGIDIPFWKGKLEIALKTNGSFTSINKALKEVYRETVVDNKDITQSANLYRGAACAALTLICQNDSLSIKEKFELKNRVLADYSINIKEIIQSLNKQQDRHSTTTNYSSSPTISNEDKSKINLEIKGNNNGTIIQGKRIDIETLNNSPNGKNDF